MKSWIVLSLLFLAMAAARPVAAQSRESAIDGNKLLERCTAKDRSLAQGCEAYVQGVADTVAVYEAAAKAANVTQAESRICVPTQVTGIQMRDAVVQWLQAHPADRAHQAGHVAVHVLRETWPCH